MQQLPQFETCQAPSAGTTSSNIYQMTRDTGLHDSDWMALIDLLCGRLNTQFEDTSHGIIQSTSIAKLWLEKEEVLDGFDD